MLAEILAVRDFPEGWMVPINLMRFHLCHHLLHPTSIGRRAGTPWGGKLKELGGVGHRAREQQIHDDAHGVQIRGCGVEAQEGFGSIESGSAKTMLHLSQA